MKTVIQSGKAKQELSFDQMDSVGGGLGWINWDVLINSDEVQKDVDAVKSGLHSIAQGLESIFSIFWN